MKTFIPWPIPDVKPMGVNCITSNGTGAITVDTIKFPSANPYFGYCCIHMVML